MASVTMPGPRSPANRVRIRRAAEGDAAIIIALRRALRVEERPEFPLDDDELRALTDRQLTGPGQVFFLAETPSETVGILRCALSPLPSEGIVPKAAVLTTAFVVPTHRRQGILTRMVRAATVWCADHEVQDLRLRNRFGNAAANAAWEALGFRAQHVTRRRTEL